MNKDMSHLSELHFKCAVENLKKYNCTKCDYWTHVKVDFDKHEQKVSNVIFRDYNCQKCKNFRTYSLLIFLKHTDDNCKPKMKTERKETVVLYQCGQCNFDSENRSDFKFHKCLSSIQVIWCKCPHCSYKSPGTSCVKNHITSRHMAAEDIPWFQCTHCPYKSKLKQNLKPHVLSNHTNPEDISWFQCDQCPFRSKQKQNLQSHTRFHHSTENIEWFECEQCEFKSKLKAYLSQHVRRKHINPDDIVWEKCDLCDFKTKYKMNLKDHVKRMHGSDVRKELVCSQCGRGMKNKISLGNHMRAGHGIPSQRAKIKCGL